MLRAGFLVVLLTLSGHWMGQGALAGQQRGLVREVGSFLIIGRSDHPELPSPIGVGAFAVVEASPRWFARISFHRSQDETRKAGVVCRTYSPRIGCDPMETTTKVTLSGLRGGILGAIVNRPRVRIALGGGLSFSQVNADARGPSGRPADLLETNAGQIGFWGLLSTAVTPARGIPLRVNAGLGSHWINFNTCSGEDPPQYDPFCGLSSIRELEMGFSYAF